jgi:leucyl aminopeptidase
MYVGDEIVTAASNVRIRVNNTDAEGRFAMGDCLYYMKEEVRNSEADIKCVFEKTR